MRLMFLAVRRFEGKDGAVRGGILVTDNETFPLEFRCTERVVPSAVHRILYGRALQRHLLSNVLGVPLLTSCRTPANLVLCDELEFLFARPSVNIPMLWVCSKDQPFTQPASEECCSVEFHNGQVVLRWHRRFGDDRAAAEKLAKIIECDIVEPFDRIRAALDVVEREGKI